MIPTDSRSWTFFIPLYRNLPADLEERTSSEAEAIARKIDVRQELFEKHNDGGHVWCPGCLRTFDQQYLDLMDVDHIVPRSRGGGRTWDNVQLLCRTCNSSKQAIPSTLFLQRKTIRYWEEAISTAGEQHPNDQLDGLWAYSLDFTYHLNQIETDNDAFPAFKLVDLFTLTLDALQGVIWKYRSEVFRSSHSKRFTSDVSEQGVQIAITRFHNCIDHASGVCEPKYPT